MNVLHKQTWFGVALTETPLDRYHVGVPSHGTLIERQPAATPGVWAEIAELGDITMPGLFRNEHETTTHNDDIDKYNLGVLRRDPVAFPMFFNKGIAGHVSLRLALIQNTVDGYRVTTPDGDIWIFSGGVSAMKETAPVDGVRTADVTIRPSGTFLLNGVEYGT